MPMDSTSESSTHYERVEVETFPDGLSSGSTILIAGAVDPSTYVLSLHALCQYGHTNETALVVTTLESADQTVNTYETICPDSDRPALNLVDTTSEQQYIPAVYEETPVVYIPSPSDLERLVLALSNLTEHRPSSNRARHLVVRSITPLLENSTTARVCTVLERITGLRTGNGLCLIGLDYTAHDEATMAALSKHVDSMLWVTKDVENRLELTFYPTQSHRTYSSTGGTDG